MNIDNVLNSRDGKSDALESKTSVLDKQSKHLESTKRREITLYSDDVKTSKKSNYKKYPKDRFTNFVKSKNDQQFIRNISRYANDWNELHNQDISLDEKFDETQRLKRIFNLYLDGTWSFDKIAKCRIRTSVLGQSTSLRIYLIMDDTSYKVFLIDPHHLVIPSRVQIREKTFQKNKGNNVCMSEALKGINEWIV